MRNSFSHPDCSLNIARTGARLARVALCFALGSAGLLAVACAGPEAPTKPVEPVSSLKARLFSTPVQPDMANLRFQHAAAALGNGRVLVCGGRSFEPRTYYSSCDVYSASDNGFHPAASLLGLPRAFLTLTATAPGRVFAVAGCYQEEPSGLIRYLDEVQRYDDSTAGGSWVSSGSIGISRRSHQAAWLESAGRLLITGGLTESEAPASSDVVGLDTTWTPLTDGSRRVDHTLTVLESGDQESGELALVVAGRPGDNRLGGSVRRYSAKTAAWTELAPIVPRYAHSATLIPGKNERVLIVGGYSDAPNLLGTALLYDPTGTGASVDAATMGTPRAFHAAALIHGKVIVTGGETADGASDQVDVYDPDHDVWYSLEPMKAKRYDHTLTAIDPDRLLVAGGRDQAGVGLKSGEVLRPSLLGESCDASLHECLSGHCVDGVCCDSACDGTCQRCDAAGVCQTDVTGAPVGVRAACANGYLCGDGACLTSCTLDAECDPLTHFCDGRRCRPKHEGACTRGAECVVGLPCVDGFCCNSACEGVCEACDKPEHEGTCTAIDGVPHGKRTDCGGSDGDCGLACDGTDRFACHFPQAGSSCSRNACSDGIEEHAGKCNGRGTCSDEPTPCRAYACDSGAGTCRQDCTDNAHCAAGYFCLIGAEGGSCVELEGGGGPCADDGACGQGFMCENEVCCAEHCAADSDCNAQGFCKKRLGASCRAGVQCGSESCVDEVCCESACLGQCEACNLEGHLGECRPVLLGDPVSPRPLCEPGDGLCGARACDGRDDHRDSCEGFLNLGKSCAEPQCLDGQFIPERACNDNGACGDGEPIPCQAYACTTAGCVTRCESAADCASGMTCIAHQCGLPGRHCSGDSLVDDGLGKTTDCLKYRCVAGECLQKCLGSADCSTGNACDAAGHCVSDAWAPSKSDGGCGCAVPGSGSRGSSRLAALALLLLVAVRRRVQRRASLAWRTASRNVPSARPS